MTHVQSQIQVTDDEERARETSECGHVLVVDDNRLNRLKLAKGLEQQGHTVRLAENGREALEMLHTESFDLVLLDILMPEIDGFEVLQRMKDDNGLRDIPVIVISALEEMESVVKCIEMGADDHLPKPFDPVLLHARIRASLGKKRLRERELAAEEALRKAAEQAQANLSRYFSPNLAKQLADDPDSLDLRGQRRNVTFVFTDITNFTPLVEGLEPAVIMPLLNEYLDEMTRIVFRHGGTVDKIVGDAVYAMFGAPLEQPHHAAHGVDCAMEMDAFCREFQQRQSAMGVSWGVTRIGVHSGPAIVGNFGGELFFNYTAYGDAINTTARLERVNKHLGTRICVSASVVEQLPDFNGRPVGTLVLKGKTEEIKVFEPLSADLSQAPATAAYRDAFAQLEAGEPSASQTFAAVMGQYGEDALATFHLKRLLAGEGGTSITFLEK